MKLKRMAAGLLACALSLAAPAAAEGADSRLAVVTQKVKAALSVPDGYSEFYGQPRENFLGTFWELNWSGESGDLSVTATEEGKVLSMYRNDNTISSSSGQFDPRFPALDQAAAKAKAQDFVNRVLTDGETAVFSENNSSRPSISSASRSFSGEIYLNGLPSPLSFNVRVRLSDGMVTSFSRGDVSEYVGDVPAAASSISQSDAAAKLKSVLDLRLEYVRDGDRAVLRYLPEERDEYYVDAATGELVNLTELREMLDQYISGGGDNSAMADAGEAPEAADQLTEEELAGIAKLEDILATGELDEKARAWSALGLDGYERSGANFIVDREASEVTVRLSYRKKTEEGVFRRYVTLDARTGALLEVYGSWPYDKDAAPKLTGDQAQARAEDFLRQLWPGQFGKTKLYESRTTDPIYYFRYAQMVDGCFFPENSLYVQVDGISGSVVNLSRSFDESIAFDSADGLVSKDTALAVWAGSYPMDLRYVSVPVKLDLMGSEAQPLLDAGMSYYNALKPGYDLTWDSSGYSGVDAKSGKLIPRERYERERVTYSDLAGSWAAPALNELAEYQVGWLGGSAKPAAALTQLDMIALLASADGYLYDPQAGRADELYQYAYRMGFLTREQRSDSKPLTRLEAVALLLDSVGYRAAANLTGIYRCNFADAGEIPEKMLGYAALAQGLGIVTGENFAPCRGATRGEAAYMLWQYMKR